MKTSNNTNTILDNIIIYITSTFKCSIEDIIDNTQDYVIKILRNLRLIKYKEADIRKERKKISQDIDDLQRAYVSSDAMTPNESGKNTGGKVNKVQLRQIKLLELREALANKVNESLVLEKSSNDNIKLLKDFIDMIPVPQHKMIVSRMYIDCESGSQIASDYFYSRGTVNVYRNRGIKSLTIILENYLKDQL